MDTSHHQLQLHHPHHHHHHNHDNHPHQQQQQQQHMLIQAAKDNDLKQVDEILKYGTSIDIRDEDGHTPLYWACCRGHVDICRRLLRRGCDVTTKGKTGTTALMACADNGQETCLQLLLQHKSVRLNDVSDRGDSALHMAAYRGVPNIVLLLCMAGADLHLHNSNGKTPLAVASIENHQECTKLLKKYGQKHTSSSYSSHSPSTSRHRWNGSPLPSRQTNDVSPNSIRLENHNHANSPPTSGSADDERFVSSDSALGLSVHSPPSSIQFSSPYSHPNSLDTTLHSSDKFDSRGSGNYSDHTHHESIGSMGLPTNAFTTHLESPVEMDERPFFTDSVSNHDTPTQQQSQSMGDISSSHNSKGSNVFHSDINTGGGMDSIGYYSSCANGKGDDAKTSHSLSYNSFGGPFFHNTMDPLCSTSSAYVSSVEDTDGPPAMCYSSAMENDHIKNIYSNGKVDVHANPSISSSANKRKISINNLSSHHKRSEGKTKDPIQYNIVDTKSDTIQTYTPNISPTKMSFKNQYPKELNVQKLNTNETEVLPGLRVSSYLDDLQLKVVMLTESLDNEKASKCQLQSENKKLREEIVELRGVIQKLTQHRSELS